VSKTISIYLSYVFVYSDFTKHPRTSCIVKVSISFAVSVQTLNSDEFDAQGFFIVKCRRLEDNDNMMKD